MHRDGFEVDEPHTPATIGTVVLAGHVQLVPDRCPKITDIHS